MASIRRASALVLALACLVLVSCAGGDGKQEIVVPHSVIEELDSYAFTTDLDISFTSAGQTLTTQAKFDGISQQPDKLQGTMVATGSLWGGPSPAEIIVIGDRAWWREPGGTWHGGTIPSEEDFGLAGTILSFAYQATPRFYFEGLSFDSVRLTVDGNDTISGIDAYYVHMDKAELIAMLDQGTFAKEGDKDPAIVREDALAFLPENTTIDVWIAKNGPYPVRLLLTMSADEGDPVSQDFFLEKPFNVRLQMDITDPHADAQIAAPE